MLETFVVQVSVLSSNQLFCLTCYWQVSQIQMLWWMQKNSWRKKWAFSQTLSVFIPMCPTGTSRNQALSWCCCELVTLQLSVIMFTAISDASFPSCVKESLTVFKILKLQIECCVQPWPWCPLCHPGTVTHYYPLSPPPPVGQGETSVSHTERHGDAYGGQGRREEVAAAEDTGGWV